MSRIRILPFLFLPAMSLATAEAQQAAPAPVQVTTTGVSRVTPFRILPGQGAAYNRDVLAGFSCRGGSISPLAVGRAGYRLLAIRRR